MDVFKLISGTNESIKLTRENYISRTKLNSKFCREDETGKHYYAVCPICDNPISIVGLYKQEDSPDVLYGRHYRDETGKLSEIAEYDEEAYLSCPYSNKKYSVNSKRKPENKTGRVIYKLMKEHFDKIVYILSKETGIFITEAKAKERLVSYINSEGWRFREATYNNIPFFLINGSPAEPLYGRLIDKNSKLYEVLSKDKNVKFEDSKRKGYAKIMSANGFLDYSYIFSRHEYVQKGEHLEEYFVLDVLSGDPEKNLKTVCQIKIEVDPNYLRNLIAYKDWKPNKDLLSYASEMMKKA